MDSGQRIDRRMRALALARDCAELGARIRTIHHITGVGTRELLRLLYSERHPPPRGRTPDTREWYHAANLLSRTEASVIVSNFRRLQALGVAAGDALVCAYRYYRSVYQPPHRISFDRAFDLAAHAEGLWIASGRSFVVLQCGACGSQYLDAPGSNTHAPDHCPFCRLLLRVEVDARVRQAFPHPPPIDRERAECLMRQLQQADGERPFRLAPFTVDRREG